LELVGQLAKLGICWIELKPVREGISREGEILERLGQLKALGVEEDEKALTMAFGPVVRELTRGGFSEELARGIRSIFAAGKLTQEERGDGMIRKISARFCEQRARFLEVAALEAIDC